MPTTQIPSPEELYLVVAARGDSNLPRHVVVDRLAPFAIVAGTGTDADKAALATLVSAFVRQPFGDAAEQALQFARTIVSIFTPGGLPAPTLPSTDPGYEAELSGIYATVARRRGFYTGPGGFTQYQPNGTLLMTYASRRR
jgi:hypothetical protein